MNEYTTSEPTQEIPYGYCHCGCGGKTKIAAKTDRDRGWIKGEPIFYIHRHRTPISGDFLHRFWSYVEVPDLVSCWEWAGAQDGAGYGALTYHGKTKKAHRVSYELSHGPIPDNFNVCHICDNRACVNPAHLFIGTHADNVADCVAKGRNSRGSKLPQAVLNEKQVTEIRARYKTGLVTQRSLASEYGVQPSAISNIIRRKTWKHLP